MHPEDKHPEVVYRRTSDRDARRVRSALTSLRGFAPALMPLIVGFLLLLVLIYGIGYLSLRSMTDVTYRAKDVSSQRIGRLNLLFDLRLKVTMLDNEARLRGRTESE